MAQARRQQRRPSLLPVGPNCCRCDDLRFETAAAPLLAAHQPAAGRPMRVVKNSNTRTMAKNNGFV
jgi:hypothetical protein